MGSAQAPGSTYGSMLGARFYTHEMKMMNGCQQSHTQLQPPPEGSGNDTPEQWNRLLDPTPGLPPRGGVARWLLSCPRGGRRVEERPPGRLRRGSGWGGCRCGSFWVKWLWLKSCCVTLDKLLNFSGSLPLFGKQREDFSSPTFLAKGLKEETSYPKGL